MSEEFGVDGALWQRAAVDGKVFVVLARGVVVYDSWQHLFAYTALTAYQHREVGRGYLYGYVDAAVQSFVVAHDVISLFDLLYGFFVHVIERGRYVE